MVRERLTAVRSVAAPDAAVALIAEEGPRARIGALLVEEGWELAGFEDVDELLAQPSRDGYALVVLHIEGSVSSPARQIELVRRSVDAPVVAICAGVQRWGVRAALASGRVARPAPSSPSRARGRLCAGSVAARPCGGSRPG